jgi:hypothetical protein
MKGFVTIIFHLVRSFLRMRGELQSATVVHLLTYRRQ